MIYYFLGLGLTELAPFAFQTLSSIGKSLRGKPRLNLPNLSSFNRFKNDPRFNVDPALRQRILRAQLAQINVNQNIGREEVFSGVGNLKIAGQSVERFLNSVRFPAQQQRIGAFAQADLAIRQDARQAAAQAAQLDQRQAQLALSFAQAQFGAESQNFNSPGIFDAFNSAASDFGDLLLLHQLLGGQSASGSQPSGGFIGPVAGNRLG